MAFRVGQKVVCIYDCPAHQRRPHAAYVEIGLIYTIRNMEMYKGKLLLRFREIANGMDAAGIEFGFNSIGFRPAVERKTDISVFTEILRTTKAPSFAERVGVSDLVGCIAQPASPPAQEADRG